jgi:phosphoribosyl-ATP pyrophosphohydrolase
MIIPSIDLIDGRAVQLRRGREFVLDGGDPLARLEQFAVAGEVAVVDLDAALGRGSNAALIREMVRRAPCRVGGGIRDLSAARGWLDAGAAKIVIGTAASPELCGALPRERVIAAVDAERGQVVVDGWRRETGVPVLERIRALASVVGGFLFTQVDREGAMDGFDFPAVAAAVRAAGTARVTAAGGITTTDEVAELDRIGADGQVGMALYTGRLTLGAAVAKPVENGGGGRGVWPTVVCDEWGRALGLVWSTSESLARAVEERRGIYWSRSRQALWVKGETSGNTQQLLRVDLDCDRDALRFTVRQHGAGFCHLERRACWPEEFTLDDLERTVVNRAARPDPDSGTSKLLGDPVLLAAKLREEAAELGKAHARGDVVHETADLLYMALVALVRGGGSLAEVRAELARRHAGVTRRPMTAKAPADAP